MLPEQFEAKTCPEAFLQQTIAELRSKLAKADAVILQVKDALSESVAYATIYITNFPANQIKALCPRCAELEKQQRILSEDYALLCGKLAETEKTIELVAMELCEENGLDENTDKKILNAIAEYKKGTVWYERNLHVLR